MNTLWIPGKLPGLNEIIRARSSRGNGVAYTSMKKALTKEISDLAKYGRLKPMASAYFTYLHFERTRQRDPSNFCSGVSKFVEDGLVHAKVLGNDGWRHILGFTHWWDVSKTKPGVFVVMNDCQLVPPEDALAIFRSKGNPA